MSFPGPDAFRTVTKHEPYYIPSADLCILVENVQFRVHRFFFERESTYFIRKLATPAPPGQLAQGTSDSNAILLEDVTPDHFAKFLWVFYNPLYSIYDAKISDWAIILDLAVRWEFPEIKNFAVRELEKQEMPVSKRIKLYHANKVDRNILIPWYAALCEREDHLTLEEGEDIGMETLVLIARGRGEARASRLASGLRSPLTPTIRGEELNEVIRELFQIAPASSSNPIASDSTDKKPHAGNGTTVDHPGESPKIDDPKRNAGKKDKEKHTKPKPWPSAVG